MHPVSAGGPCAPTSFFGGMRTACSAVAGMSWRLNGCNVASGSSRQSPTRWSKDEVPLPASSNVPMSQVQVVLTRKDVFSEISPLMGPVVVGIALS